MYNSRLESNRIEEDIEGSRFRVSAFLEHTGFGAHLVPEARFKQAVLGREVGRGRQPSRM